MGKIFGYARISKTDQNLDLQKDSLLNFYIQIAILSHSIQTNIINC